MDSILVAIIALLGFTTVVIGSIGSLLKTREAALREVGQ